MPVPVSLSACTREHFSSSEHVSHLAGLFEKSELVDKLLATLAEESNASEATAAKEGKESALAEKLCLLGGFRGET